MQYTSISKTPFVYQIFLDAMWIEIPIFEIWSDHSADFLLRCAQLCLQDAIHFYLRDVIHFYMRVVIHFYQQLANCLLRGAQLYLQYTGISEMQYTSMQYTCILRCNTLLFNTLVYWYAIHLYIRNVKKFYMKDAIHFISKSRRFPPLLCAALPEIHFYIS